MAMVPMGTNQTQARRASQSWSDMVRREGAQQAGSAGQNSFPSAGQAQSQQSPYANSTPYGQQQSAALGGFQTYAPQQQALDITRNHQQIISTQTPMP